MSENAKGKRWRAAISVLANRDFAILWNGVGLIALGNAVLNIALTKLVFDKTGSASGVGLLVLTNILAMVLVTPISGVLIDRFSRKKLLIIIGFLRILLVACFMWTRSPLAIYAINRS